MTTDPPPEAPAAAGHWTAWPPWKLWRRILHGSSTDYDANQLTLGQCQVLLGVFAIGLAMVATILGVIAVVPIVRDLVAVKQAQLIITSPKDGDAVGLGQKVRGNTPFLDMNHYILVTRISNGDIRTERATVHPDGTFTGEAKFGDVESGEDDEYSIQVFTTRNTPPPNTLPADATYSNPVKVGRVQPETYVVIVSPTEGAEVTVEERVVGRTSVPELNHYVVVTPLKVGTAFVQDEPALVNPKDGTFSGKARFGAAQLGAGERFSVRVLATRSTLRPGPLTREGAVSSDAVTVTRKN